MHCISTPVISSYFLNGYLTRYAVFISAPFWRNLNSPLAVTGNGRRALGVEQETERFNQTAQEVEEFLNSEKAANRPV